MWREIFRHGEEFSRERGDDAGKEYRWAYEGVTVESGVANKMRPELHKMAVLASNSYSMMKHGLEPLPRLLLLSGL